MKKLLLFSLMLCPSAVVWAQTRTFIAEDNLYTIATLPTPATTLLNLVVIVTDANAPGSCTVGGGTARSFCQNTGTAWVSLGGTGGGGGAALQTNSVNNSNQGLLNFLPSTANTAGLAVTPSNPSGGIERLEVSGTLSCGSYPPLTGAVTSSGCATVLANTVTSGLTSDCELKETVGTAIACPPAANGTLGGGFNAPLPLASIWGTVLGMNNFGNATLATDGSWTVTDGAFTTAANALTTSGVGGDTYASAAYTAIPASQNQWVQYTFGGTLGIAGAGPAVHMQLGASTYYACNTTGATIYLVRVIAGAITILNSVAAVVNAGDSVTMSDFISQDRQTNTLSCYVNANTTPVVTATDNSIGMFDQGYTGVFSGGVAAPTAKNFQTGSPDPPTSGGFVFGGGQYISLPASLNSSRTLEVFTCYQTSSNANLANAPILGNGNGAAANANGIDFTGGTTATNPVLQGSLGHIFLIGGSATTTSPISTMNGCGLATATFGTSIPSNVDHVYLNGKEASPYALTEQGASAGLQTVGNYQIGGAAAGSGVAIQSYYTGTIYRVRTFNRALSPAEVWQDYQAISSSIAQNRGIPVSSGSNALADTVVALGDSITSGAGFTPGPANTQVWTQIMTLYSPANALPYGNSGYAWNQAMSGADLHHFMINAAAPDPVVDPLFTVRGGRNVLVMFLCTNDLNFLGLAGAGSGQCVADTASMSRIRRSVGWKVIVTSMISRGTAGSCTADPGKNVLNPLFRSSWSTYADGFVDLGSHVAFADGACTGTAFQADNTHPSQYGMSLIAYLEQREINTIFGNHDFSVGNTYTATATAATATTVGTSSGYVATITMAATQPWAAGQCVVLAGITPVGYNTTAGHCNLVLTSTATQITVTTAGTTLGPITVQGTVRAAQELDQDQYATLGGASSGQIHTLQTCQGRTGHSIYRRITQPTNAWTITPFGAETINGGATLTAPVAVATNYPVVRLDSILTSNAAGGCSWRASLQ